MTTPLRDALDDLVTEVPAHVVPTDLGRRAWQAGRRRRVRRRVAIGALVAAAAILAVPVVPFANELPQLLSATDRDHRGVDGYPQRIGHQLWIRMLPDRPGPVAALLEAGQDDVRWYAVAENGHRWRLPAMGEDGIAISRDGRRIGYLLGERGPYVIHDLVTGTRTEFPVGIARVPITTPYYVYLQSPTFWSPDGQRIAQFGAMRGSPPDGAVVLGIDGSVTFVRGGVGRGFVAGWVGSDALLWVNTPTSGEPTSGANVVATVTGLDGEPRRTITLRPSSPWQGSFAGQRTGTASPDGREILIVEEASLGGVHYVRRFSLLDGRETTAPLSTSSLGSACAAGWADAVPIVSVHDGVTATTAVVRGGQPHTMVAVEPSVGARCFIWAGDAISGKAHGWPLGTSTAWWTWWLRELAAALAVAVAVIGAYVRAVQRARRG